MMAVRNNTKPMNELLNETLTIVLAGGHGSRLKPLTHERAKPAVPFGGKYRIIDFCLANCLHSGLRRVLVLTQYKSHSLHKHLRDGWSIFNPELGEYITAVPPQMRQHESWYEGTADAIHQNQYLLDRADADQVLILSADHIYRMDFGAMLSHHHDSGAEVTVASMPVSLAEARAFGVVVTDEEQRIVGFEEKPEQPKPFAGQSEQALVSMGIYIFSKALLQQLLDEDAADSNSSHDFGHDILPRILERHRVIAYPFGGNSGRVSRDCYWRDIGTIDAYYAANMDLLSPVPPLNLYQPDWPIRTFQRQTPPARTVPGASGNEGIFINSIAAGGVVIAGGSVRHSVIFPHVFIDDEAMVEDAILFQGVKVGNGSRLRRCIVDKHVTIPPYSVIGYDQEEDLRRFTVSPDGVVVVPKGFRFET